MEVSPLRALTHLSEKPFAYVGTTVEMGVSPLRALTLSNVVLFGIPAKVEMGVSPLRALTPCHAAACQDG